MNLLQKWVNKQRRRAERSVNRFVDKQKRAALKKVGLQPLQKRRKRRKAAPAIPVDTVINSLMFPEIVRAWLAGNSARAVAFNYWTTAPELMNAPSWQEAIPLVESAARATLILVGSEVLALRFQVEQMDAQIAILQSEITGRDMRIAALGGVV